MRFTFGFGLSTLVLSTLVLVASSARAADAAGEVPSEDAMPARPWALRGQVVTGYVAEGLNQGLGGYHDAGLVGLGVALRLKLDPRFALQLEGDMFGGVNTAGYARAEALGLGGLHVFLNPDDRVQVFVEGTLGVAMSRVGVRQASVDGPTFTYYDAVGGGGVGLEWVAFERLSFTAQLRGLLRRRLGGLAANDVVMRDAGGREATLAAMTMFGVGASYLF